MDHFVVDIEDIEAGGHAAIESTELRKINFIFDLVMAAQLLEERI